MAPGRAGPGRWREPRHAHNVVKRLEELDWVERGRDGLYRLPRPGELLDAWRDEYSYRVNGLGAFISPGGTSAESWRLWPAMPPSWG